MRVEPVAKVGSFGHQYKDQEKKKKKRKDKETAAEPFAVIYEKTKNNS